MVEGLTQDKADIIAAEYYTNGFQKAGALITAGFPADFAATVEAAAIFDEPIVLDAMVALSARSAELTDISVDEIVKGMRDIAFGGEGTTNAQKNIALANLAKFKNMFFDNREVARESEEQKEMSKQDTAISQAFAGCTSPMGCEGWHKRYQKACAELSIKPRH